MFSRRDFLQVGMATSAIYGASGFGSFSKLSAQQKLSQDDLLRFDTYGNVTRKMGSKTKRKRITFGK